MGKNSIVKVVIIVAALGAAVAIYASTGRTQKAGVAPDAKDMDLVCTKCENHFTMPYQEYKKVLKTATVERTGEGPMKRRRDVKPVMITCPKCNEQAALVANRCPKHDVFFPKQNPDGSNGACPKCK